MSSKIKFDRISLNDTVGISLLDLEEFGKFLCNIISLQGHECSYMIGKNEHGSSHILLFIDGKMYTYTHVSTYEHDKSQNPHRMWEMVGVHFSSLIRREIFGKGLSYKSLSHKCG